MITLQQLLDFAKEKGIDPKDCVILFAEQCGNGDWQHDYLYEPLVATETQVVNHDDIIDTVPVAISLKMKPW